MTKDTKTATPPLSLDQFISVLSAQIVGELNKMAENQEVKHGAGISEALLLTIMSSLTASLVQKNMAVSVKPNQFMSERDRLRYATERYTTVKDHVQTAVSSGFAGAMSQFSGQPLEYYCQIKPVPAVVNKEPC